LIKVTQNHVVSLDYRLQLDDGTVVDESEPGEPLLYLHGHGQIVPGLERAVEGMSAGEAKKVQVSPADGYGQRDDDKVEKVPRKNFPPDAELEPGAIMTAETDDGHMMQFVVLSVDPEMVVVDFNHPLAGRTLNFDITVREVRVATAEELSHGHVHGDDDHHHH
jgi:FKBP-type peptidyl-prolyl cis-trans isomerase SlyD